MGALGGGDEQEKEIDPVKKWDLSKKGICVFSCSHESYLREKKYFFSFVLSFLMAKGLETFELRETLQII